MRVACAARITPVSIIEVVGMNISIRNAVRLAIALSAAAAMGQVGSVAAAEEEESAIVAANTADTGPTEEVVVIGRQRSAATDVMQERMDQEVVVDLLGAEQISRVGDSTVSAALRRLPGVTLVSDQFIYIRGLGERYSSTTLNGAYVPSPDLTRNVIPLDLFPAEIIDSLSVSKGFSADMPAAFGGGNVDIRTTGMPDELVMDFQFGSGWNTSSSDKFLTYAGGDDDWQGSDDGTRALPGEIKGAIQNYLGDLSPNGILRGLNRDGEPHSIAQAQAINRELATSLNRDVEFKRESTDPDYTFEAALGNSWYIDESERWRVGVLALGDYKNQSRNRERITRDALDPDQLFFKTQRSVNQIALTGSLNLGVEYGQDHKIEATGMYLRNTEDEASLSTGHTFNFTRADGRQLRNYRIRYEERDLELVQFHGSHTLGDDTLDLVGWDSLGFLEFAKDLKVDWFYSDATARTDIPNELLIAAEDSIDPSTGNLIATGIRRSGSAADYRFTDLIDKVESSGWSAGLPFEFGTDSLLTITVGQDEYLKARRYLQTQLQLGANLPNVLGGTPGGVFTDENILDPANGFSLGLGGIGTESYLAAERVDAAFTKFDLNLMERWRIAGGVRWEQFRQIAVPVDQYQFDPNVGKIPIPADQLPSLITDEDDFYPSMSLTYMAQDFWAEDFQLRFGWSETVARPDLREISAATYIDPLSEARVLGNPDLVHSDIMNFDVRAEWFFGSGDNFTVSLFYKDLENPIETVEGAGTDDDIALTFINAESAEVYGVEVEWLKSLGFFADSLGGWTDSFFVAGNFTWSDSELVIGRQALNMTNSTRRMTQQSDYVANLQLGFDSPGRIHSAALVLNSFGERIFFAGRNGAPDAVEKPFHSVDLTYSFYPTETLSFKFRAQNLLDEKTEIERGKVVALEQDFGLTFKLDAALKF
jgi:TonB-dependent receptor